MQQSQSSRVIAIASRDLAKARAVAGELGIPRAYGSYEELLADPDVEAVYNPLPNHLHVPWSIRAAQTGKHVLCEKPIALSAREARTLLRMRNRTHVQISEAFMVRVQPRWLAVRDMVLSGRIGKLSLITGHFSYFNRDPANVRSRVDWGGGGLMDIGCYPVTLSRWIFDAEPLEVIANLERDPEMGIDRLVSALLKFPEGQAIFSCATQLVPSQNMQIYGTQARIDVEIPFNTPADSASRISIDDGSDITGNSVETIEFPAMNQYVLECDRFAEAVRGNRAVAVTLEDSIANMAVIDALFRSAESGKWESPAAF